MILIIISYCFCCFCVIAFTYYYCHHYYYDELCLKIVQDRNYLQSIQDSQYFVSHSAGILGNYSILTCSGVVNIGKKFLMTWRN